MTCVPVVIAGGPGEWGAEGEEQVEQRPGQDNGVGHTTVEDNQLPTMANACRPNKEHFDDLISKILKTLLPLFCPLTKPLTV